MARNQCVSGSLLASKIVPLITLHWWRQAVHWKYSLPSRRNELLRRLVHIGQMKPEGQRDAINAASHLSPVPYRLLNSAIESPR
jgi:hypothetical protein